VDVSFEELAEIMQQDVGLSAKIIAVANSPAYAQWNGVRDFNRLLVALGLNTIKTIAITSAVHQFFSQFNSETGRWFGEFWHRSLLCACSARALARLTNYESLDEAYLAGLLHRVGQLVFMKQAPDQYLTLLSTATEETQVNIQERELFGGTCPELGALLAREWELSPFLSDAIRYQREPADALLDTPRLVRLINFSHKLSEGKLSPELLYKEADLLFGLSQPVIEDLLVEVKDEVARAAEGLGIDLDDGGDGFYADSEEVRLELARKVREFALLDGARQNMGGADDLGQMLGAILQDINLLFGLSRGICFLLDSGRMTLQASAGNCLPKQQLRELQIVLKRGRSLVAESLIDERVRSTFDVESDTPRAVVDGQLSKLLDSEGILCIPLATAAERVGVLVAGLDGGAWPRLAGQMQMLNCFAGVAADLVHQRQHAAQERETVLEQEREHQQQQIRKLVHEANNPLAIISNYLQVLSLRLKQDPSVQEQLSILSEEIERVGNIILRMRDVSGPSELPQGSVEINDLIGDLLEIFQISLFTTHGIRAEVSLDASMPAILSNRNSLKQILTNLIKNAVEAMPQGGVISIGTRDQVNLDGRQYVELRVSDDGPGLSSEVLANVFSPVKSSKGKGHAGLGLTIVRNLVSDLGGSISCRNRKRGGVEFLILLPRKTANP
jgi:signal transduction histidine kinase/HD-like signal output (HDOD) protein